MESIYPPERFKSSENVDLLKYFSDFSNYISSELSVYTKSIAKMDKTDKQPICEDMQSVIGLDNTIPSLESLDTDCSIDLLMCDGEIKKRPILKPLKYTLRSTIFDGLPFKESNSELEVLKKMAEIEKVRSCEKLILMNKDNFHKPIIESNEDMNLAEDLSAYCDFAMNIFLYKPFCYNFQTKNYSEKFRFSQEIQLLGRNTLTELRDSIICTSDSGLQAEVKSPTENISHLLKAKEEYPSGCFFIDGVFYNDMRSPKANDYSEVIIKWARDRQVGAFSSADMHVTTLMQLSPKFGYPYVYIHQGDCEHIMVFADAHILTTNDCLNSKRYPRIYAMNKNTCVMCYMCNLFAARWLVKEYSRLPQSSTFLCTKCTQSYCYKDGNKIGEFKLYPIFNKLVDLFGASDEPKISNNTVQ